MTRIDIVASRQSLHHVAWTVPQAFAGHHDQCSGAGFNGIARLDIGDAVTADDLPVGAARKDAAVKLRPAHASARDPDHASLAIGCMAEIGDGLELGVD